jgi:hypothetical protein
VSQYEGEISVEPNSGSILRLTVKTAVAPPSPIHRADVLIEYGAVEIGGKSYICPVRSISITTATDIVPRGSVTQGFESIPKNVETPRVTAINDVVFDNYHVFRSEVRILPSTEGNSP